MEIGNALAVTANFLLVPGLSYGCQLALGALGVTLVYGILRFSNFAHGEVMSLGAAVSVAAMWGLQAAGIGLGPLPTVLLALPLGILAAVAVCLASDRLVYRGYRRRGAAPVILLIASIGIMFLLGGMIRLGIGPDDRTVTDGARFVLTAREFKAATGLREALVIKTSQVVTVVATVIAVGALFWFLERTRTGKAMRAYADNEDLALLSGVDPDRVVRITWIITGALAAVAGTLYGLDKSYKPFVFMQLLLPIFAAAIVGGLGSPLGAVAGGFVIAFSELGLTFAWRKVAGYLGPEGWRPDGLVQLLGTDYKFAISFLILVAVLLIRPTGLFGGRAP